jgi:hypothetical protein
VDTKPIGPRLPTRARWCRSAPLASSVSVSRATPAIPAIPSSPAFNIGGRRNWSYGSDGSSAFRWTNRTSGAKRCFRHFARRDLEFPMANLAAAHRMAVDGHLVGRVSDHHLSELALQQTLVGFRLPGIAANQAMPTQLPNITAPADRRSIERSPTDHPPDRLPKGSTRCP